MASDDDDLVYGLAPEPDKKESGPPKPPPEEERSEEQRREDELTSYDMEPPADEGEEIGKKVHEGQRRKRNNRSLLKADMPVSPFTLSQGWFDGLFTIPFLAMTIVTGVFLFPIVFPVAILGAIFAHDPEARRGAFVVMGFCFLMPLLFGCILCMSGALQR